MKVDSESERQVAFPTAALSPARLQDDAPTSSSATTSSSSSSSSSSDSVPSVLRRLSAFSLYRLSSVTTKPRPAPPPTLANDDAQGSAAATAPPATTSEAAGGADNAEDSGDGLSLHTLPRIVQQTLRVEQLDTTLVAGLCAMLNDLDTEVSPSAVLAVLERELELSLGSDADGSNAASMSSNNGGGGGSGSGISWSSSSNKTLPLFLHTWMQVRLCEHFVGARNLAPHGGAAVAAAAARPACSTAASAEQPSSFTQLLALIHHPRFPVPEANRLKLAMLRRHTLHKSLRLRSATDGPSKMRLQWPRDLDAMQSQTWSALATASALRISPPTNDVSPRRPGTNGHRRDSTSAVAAAAAAAADLPRRGSLDSSPRKGGLDSSPRKSSFDASPRKNSPRTFTSVPAPQDSPPLSPHSSASPAAAAAAAALNAAQSGDAVAPAFALLASLNPNSPLLTRLNSLESQKPPRPARPARTMPPPPPGSAPTPTNTPNATPTTTPSSTPTPPPPPTNTPCSTPSPRFLGESPRTPGESPRTPGGSPRDFATVPHAGAPAHAAATSATIAVPVSNVAASTAWPSSSSSSPPKFTHQLPGIGSSPVVPIRPRSRPQEGASPGVSPGVSPACSPPNAHASPSPAPSASSSAATVSSSSSFSSVSSAKSSAAPSLSSSPPSSHSRSTTAAIGIRPPFERSASGPAVCSPPQRSVLDRASASTLPPPTALSLPPLSALPPPSGMAPAPPSPASATGAASTSTGGIGIKPMRMTTRSTPSLFQEAQISREQLQRSLATGPPSLVSRFRPTWGSAVGDLDLDMYDETVEATSDDDGDDEHDDNKERETDDVFETDDDSGASTPTNSTTPHGGSSGSGNTPTPTSTPTPATTTTAAATTTTTTNNNDEDVDLTDTDSDSGDEQLLRSSLPTLSVLLRNLTARELACNLTLIDQRQFLAIEPAEFWHAVRHAKNKKTVASKVVANILWFNQLSYWVSLSICSCPSAEQRVLLLAYFINVAHECMLLHNFNTLTAIIGGLNNVAVQRLRPTWSALTVKLQDKWKSLNQLMENKKNYAQYREALRGVSQLPVPFLGVPLRDLTFIEDGNLDWIPTSPTPLGATGASAARQLNLEKLRMVGQVLLELSAFQHYKPNNLLLLSSSHDIIAALGTEIGVPVPEHADDLLYEKSLEIHPAKQQV